MSCGRLAEIDPAAFAADPQDPQWSEFRSHYPGCEDCSRAVASWSRLRAALSDLGGYEGVAPAHPSTDELLAIGTRPGRLDAARRAEIERHLEGCAPCRSERGVLWRFDFEALGARDRMPGVGERLREWLAAWLLPPPLQVIAVVTLVAVSIPAAYWVWQEGVGTPPSASSPQIVRGRAPSQALRTGPAEWQIELPPQTQIAQQLPPTPPAAEEVAPTPPTPSTPEPAPAIEIAREAPRPEAAIDDSELPAAPLEVRRVAPADLAALLPEEAPLYQPRPELAGASLEPVRLASVVRGEGDALPSLHALAPEHVGATLRPAPVLYWHLSAESPVAIEVSLVDEEGVEPLFERRIDAPVPAGLHALHLSEHDLRLAPGRTYRWYAALVPDPQQRDRDRISGAALRYEPASSDLESVLADGPPARRGHVLARAGYWFDAFDALAEIASASPSSERAARQRNALLEQAGLPEVAEALGP